MKNSISPMASNELKSNVKKFICFQNGGRWVWKAEDENIQKPSLRSKYRKILICSFTGGSKI